MHSQEVFCMQTQYLIPPEVPQVPPYEAQQMAQGLAGDLALFLFPLLVTLDRLLDKRLVRTFLQTIQVILASRDRGLWRHWPMPFSGTCSSRPIARGVRSVACGNAIRLASPP